MNEDFISLIWEYFNKSEYKHLTIQSIKTRIDNNNILFDVEFDTYTHSVSLEDLLGLIFKISKNEK